jgi:translation initiation factor 1 (eIF-1/SUI1)
MPELTATLNAMREAEHREQKFLAAIQGIDLESSSGKGQKEWEDLKSKVFSGGTATDSNDILSLQGHNAAKAGFGIGSGLDYVDAKDLTQIPSW